MKAQWKDYYENLLLSKHITGASLLAQMVKNLPTMQENHFWSLGLIDTLEKGMATHSSILAWRIPWSEETGGLQSMGLQRIWHDWSDLHFHSSLPNISPSFILPVCDSLLELKHWNYKFIKKIFFREGVFEIGFHR